MSRQHNDAAEQKRRRGTFSLRSLFLCFGLFFAIFFMLVTAYSYYDMSLIRSSSASLAKNSIPSIMNAQRSLVNLERLKGFLTTMEQSADPVAARNAYIDASALLSESMFEIEDVAVISRSVLNKVKLMWNTRSNLIRTHSELIEDWIRLALIVNRIELQHQQDQQDQQGNFAQGHDPAQDFLGWDYAPESDFSGFMLSDHVKKQYEQAAQRCSAHSQEMAAACAALAPARESFERNYSHYNAYRSDLRRRSEDIEFLVNLMSSSYTQNETTVISAELGRISDISKDLSFYLGLISAFVLLSCAAGYLIIYTILVKPLQHITAFINRFNRRQSIDDLKLPVTRIAELNEVSALLRHLFADVQKITSDSERITQRYSELLTISYYDELTGAHNRRALELFNRTMGEVPQRCAVMMIDIDFFKKFNDTMGHQKGDMVLRRVSVCLIKNTSESDIVYRYGGEEFCIVLQNVDRTILASIARRLCQAVRQMDIINPGNDHKPVTISIGISPAAAQKGQWSLEELIAKADAALYEAKRTGRERFVFYEEGQDTLL